MKATMRMILLGLAIGVCLSAFTFAASAAPFLVADVTAAATQCGVVIDGGGKVLVPAAGLQCKYDLAMVAVGTHSATMTALNDWSESVPSPPFAFSRPAVPAVPGNVRLSP